MILELGAELISSDAVALYELIKNAIDAGSPDVRVSVQVVLRRSLFLEALEALEDEGKVGPIRGKLLDNLEPNAPPAARAEFRATLLRAGDDPEEFDSALRAAYHDHNWIEVRDRGHGMSRLDLDKIFLTIGTRSRRSEKVSATGEFIAPGRTVLGDKGVGRLSAMRLGDHMVVRTTRAGEQYESLLDIDWTRFSHESSELIGDVELAPTRGPRKPDTAQQGTWILIRDLKGDWDTGTFKRMVDEQFKRIIDPFPASEHERRNDDRRDPNDVFQLRFNGHRHEIEGIPGWLLGQAHAVVTAEFGYEADGSPRLWGKIDYRHRSREKDFERNEAELMSLTDPIADRLIRTGPRTLRDMGPFRMQFHWYNRRILKEVTDLKMKRGDVLAAVNSWAGGLMVFRDGFRINPYGGLDDDWLELDKKALGARGYKVNRSQIIGSVNLTSRNFHLVEQTNREGLADNEYKQVLVGMLRHILISEFRNFIEHVDKERKVADESTVDDLEARIEEASDKIDVKLLDLRRNAPEQSEAIDELRRLAATLARLVDRAKAMAQEYEDDRSKFVHLAGIGLMVEFILHEIGRATTRALSVMEDIDVGRLDRSGSASMRTLQDQLKTLGKRVETLDPLSTSRRQTREQFDLAELIRQIVDGRSQQTARHRIEVTLHLPSRPLKVKAVKGMLIQILENLFENAVYWLKIEQRRRRGFEATIEIALDARARELTFTDNGPGIDLRRSEQVFEAFETSKPPGQGRGLGLFISREMAQYHDWELSLDQDTLNENGRTSTFVLELGDGS
ncbi:sensor histidine kinase [Methylorubrum extorquens]|uniref:histidine kinase n=1 Tax=Methylorubrum extorquens TaxID=408 RepID=A0AAX3WRB6_METEX|nr:sensor histidine kinase [Methylorubrum extorquens]WHQ72903.1 sensor histidine kinase [Methylorubrum extorquens]